MYSLRSQQKKVDRKERDERALVEKKINAPEKCLEDPTQTKLDFPIRKRRQENAVTRKNTSPSKKDKSDHLDCQKKPFSLDFKRKSSTLEEAKTAFHSSLPSRLICREREIEFLQSFLLTHITNHTPGALYISGPPGTGKTATLMHLIDQNKDLLEEVDVVIVNCMCISTPQSIFSKIANELGLKKNSAEKRLNDYITSSDSMIILVLDEIDQLDCRGQMVLYTLFEWPSLVDSHLILIGIANSLDLTDRLLPRLQTQPHASPDLLTFPPYTKDHILKILQDRLGADQNIASVIDTSALQFCARKVAAAHGDARKALDICRRAIELVETQTKACDGKVATPGTVGISLISQIVDEVYGGMAKKAAIADSVPLQQKLVACSILLMTKEKSNKDIPLNKLFTVYVSVCHKQSLRHESQSEFISLLHMLEAQGIVGIKKAKETLLQKVSLRYQESELRHILNDETLLSSILAKGI